MRAGRIGVLLVNLGTPDATDYWSMRRYLKEFLSDRRVIETPRWLWWPILNLVILTVRPARKGHDYDSIWNRERDESPLRTITRAQPRRSRYGSPRRARPSSSTGRCAMAIRRCRRGSRRCRKMAASAFSSCRSIRNIARRPPRPFATRHSDALKEMRWQPALRVAPPWPGDAVYIDALAVSLEAELKKLPFEPEVILASFHGVPKDYLLRGDPYYCHCALTTRLLRARLGVDERKLMMTFQSRFGPAEWLQPYTAETVAKWRATACGGSPC